VNEIVKGAQEIYSLHPLPGQLFGAEHIYKSLTSSQKEFDWPQVFRGVIPAISKEVPMEEGEICPSSFLTFFDARWKFCFKGSVQLGEGVDLLLNKIAQNFVVLFIKNAIPVLVTQKVDFKLKLF
jgi:hypothetical protein